MTATPTSLSYAGSASSADLTVNGSTVTLGSGQSVTMAGFDLTGSHAECTLGRGGGSADVPAGSTPAGSTDFGFSDTTYVLTAAQLLAGSLMGA